MKIVAALEACGVHPAKAAEWAPAITAATERFQINTPGRLAAFIGQVIVETDALQALCENLNYRTPARLRQVFPTSVRDDATAERLIRGGPEAIGNHVYAGRNGNGDVLSGDGYRYRGRGAGHLTGRANYAAAEQALGEPYVTQPDLVALPRGACLTFAHYWHINRCNQLADGGNIDLVTRAVNGRAMLKAAERRSFTVRALRALS